MPFTLLVPRYTDCVTERDAEFEECLRKNLVNGAIERVVLFIEDDGVCPLHHSKLSVVRHGRRSTYRDFFLYANENFIGKIVIVANSDIYFDDTLSLAERVRWQNVLVCLSRWDVQANGELRLFSCNMSQDAWMFLAPIAEFSCDFQLGRPGCDNRLAYEASGAGMRLLNPCKTVHACHLHLSGVRNYHGKDRLNGGLMCVAQGSI